MQTERLVKALLESIQDYSSIGDDALRQDIYDSCALNVRFWYDRLQAGSAATREDLEILGEVGRRRARQGIPLASLLRALRTGPRLLWEDLLKEADDDPALTRELLTKVSPYVFYYADVVALTMSEAYLDEQQNHARWHDRIRSDLCALIFNNPEDIGGFREHALALGIDITLAHTALALKLKGDQSPVHTPRVDDSPLQPIIEAISRTIDVAPTAIVRTRRYGHQLLWLPSGNPSAPVASERRLVGKIEAALRDRKEVSAIGVGLPNLGPTGWRLSAEQALKALELGARLTVESSMFRYSDLAIGDLIAGAESVARYFTNLLEPLESEPELLETLRVYLKLNQQRKRAASALQVHPNTLIYRLRRVETLLGLKLSDTSAITKLHVAIQIREISHPSPPPLPRS